MIKSLRKKFILIAMCSTFGVLAVIMGIILTSNYVNMVERADRLLEYLVENDGEFPRMKPFDDPEKKMMRQSMEREFAGTFTEQEKREDRLHGFSPETPYETRFFSVLFDENGEIKETETGNIAAIEETQARKLAAKAKAGGKTKGFLEKYRYHIADREGKTFVVFVDCTRDLQTFRQFLLISISVSLFGCLMVFLLVLFFSRLVFRPVAESYDRQKRFITDASHELKTPLTIIDANTEVLEMVNGESEWTESTRKQVRRLASLTEKMVTLSRMDEGGEHLSLAEIDLSKLAADTAEAFAPLAEAKGKDFTVDIEEQIFCRGDEAMLEQMLSLLLDNAVKYSDENGIISLTLKKKGRKILLQVFNTTAEMEKGKQDILFERFYRRDASRNSQTGGSGIGLSVAKAIAEAHGGKIAAVSEDGASLLVTMIFSLAGGAQSRRR